MPVTLSVQSAEYFCCPSLKRTIQRLIFATAKCLQKGAVFVLAQVLGRVCCSGVVVESVETVVCAIQ